MVTYDGPKTIRKVRQRLGLSQEALSRRLNATKGAIQHWERGRNRPDLARLMALRQICPPGAERRELDGLLRQVQQMVAPESRANGAAVTEQNAAYWGTGRASELRKENDRLQEEVRKLQAALERRAEQIRIFANLTADLQREIADLRERPLAASPPSGTPRS